MTMQFSLDIFADEDPSEVVNPHEYDYVIVFFSGGKDSIACVLMLLEMGIKPELWHHDVDGKGENFFDWPCTRGYVDSFGKHFELPVYHSWREGGLEAELTKKDARTKAVFYEKPDGSIGKSGGERGAIATRRRWPSVGSDLRTRWCSPIAKIDVGSAAISGQERFRGRKVLVITGERAQESAARAKYKTVEPHRSNAPGKRVNRKVTQWRPVLHWSEEQVWEIIERHKVQPHPCYRLGISRCSCMICIFSSSRQAAMVEQIDPARHEKRDPLIMPYNSWDELVSDADDSDPEIKRLVKIVKDYGDSITNILERLSALNRPNINDADIIMSTAHKAKGLEAPCVVVLDDFTSLNELRTQYEMRELDTTSYNQELHLMYVALTRGINRMMVAPAIYHEIMTEMRKAK